MASFAHFNNNAPEIVAGLKAGINGGLKEVQRDALNQIDRGFERGTDAQGNPWKPLAPRTIAETGPQILVDESDLRSSFGGDLDASTHQLELFNDDWKAPIHEFGAKDRNIPARPFMRPAARYIDDEAIDKRFVPLIRDHLVASAVL